MSWIDEYEYVPTDDSLVTNQIARATVEVYVPGIQGPAANAEASLPTSGIVRFDVAQALTEREKAQARLNIGAAPENIPSLIDVYLDAKETGISQPSSDIPDLAHVYLTAKGGSINGD